MAFEKAKYHVLSEAQRQGAVSQGGSKWVISSSFKRLNLDGTGEEICHLDMR